MTTRDLMDQFCEDLFGDPGPIMREFYFNCRCGGRTDFETEAEPGLTIWRQCDRCGTIAELTLPGKYQGRKPRASSRRKQAAILQVFREMSPRLTVRQVYYQLAVAEVVPKTQSGYRQAQYQLATLRRAGVLPFGWLADNTRWQIKPTVYSGLESAMQIWHDAYRRDLWAQQEAHVEVWVEKDALAGVISPITREYAVPLYVARGFSSMTFVFDAVQEISEIEKPVYIYHFGDLDPSGVAAADALREELRRHGSGARFESAAVTIDQVRDLNLPTLKVNRKDPRAKTWPYPFVCELDALPPRVLRDLVRQCIERHIDADQLRATRQAETLERESLDWMRGYLVQEQNNNGGRT